MSTCSSCGAQLPIAVRFCSSCGVPVGSDDVATLEFATAASPHPPRPGSSSSSRPPSSSGFSLSEGRFLPGRLLAHLAVELPTEILIYSIAVLIVVRFGLVPLACAVFTVDLLVNVPFTAALSAWYASTAIFVLLSVAALAAWGFYNALGGEPLWNLDANERLRA